MSFEAFLRARRITDKSAEDLRAAMSALQVRMADQLADLLLTLEVDGKDIRPTEANVVKMAEIIRLLKEGMNDPKWVEAVRAYVASFDDIEGAVLKYGRTMGAIDDGPLTAIKAHFQTAIADFLLNPASFNRSLFVPLDRTLSAAVTMGANFDETSKFLRDKVKGTADTTGGVEQGATGAADTAVTVYERSATQQIADQVGSDIFMYQGRNIATTRQFCSERAGHAWHRTEIEQWADLDWPGKVDGTDASTIFIFLGGWYGDQAGCRHVLVPLSQRDVPAQDLARMRGKGLLGQVLQP